jgi:hypothetical protein
MTDTGQRRPLRSVVEISRKTDDGVTVVVPRAVGVAGGGA